MLEFTLIVACKILKISRSYCILKFRLLEGFNMRIDEEDGDEDSYLDKDLDKFNQFKEGFL
jgi:hypothetical protein